MSGRDEGMTYAALMGRIIDDGIQSCRDAYQDPGQTEKREGAIRGFEDCRGKAPDELIALKAEADRTVLEKMLGESVDYWYWRYRALQVEWVLNVLSAAEHANGRIPHIPPTARGLNKAAQILGVG